MAAADFQAISLVTFLWGLAKKVTRLPAGTGEVKVFLPASWKPGPLAQLEDSA
jgi:hypothetical protein